MHCSASNPNDCKFDSYLVGGAAGKIFTDLNLEKAALKYSFPQSEHYGLSGFPADFSNMCSTGRFRHPGFNYLYEACDTGSVKQPTDFKNVHDYSAVHLAMDDLLAVGQSCSIDVACSGGLSCVQGKCIIELLEGATCSDANPCSGGMLCTKGICQYSYGNACVGDNVCGEFLKCDSGFCQAPCEFETALKQSCKKETQELDCTFRLFHCKESGSCGRLNGLVNGEQCKEGLSCVSGFCVDGVCCDKACGEDKADCLACSKAAGAEKDGECATAAAGTLCRSNIDEDDAENPCDLKEVCDGKVSACPEDVFAADKTSCNTSGVCKFGACLLQGQNGSGCKTSDDCISGNCVDEVCCDTNCDGECSSCSNASGTCTALENGALCGDGDLCTVGDTCQDGKCTAGKTKSCTPADECYQAADCVSKTGECVDVVYAADGTPCTGGTCVSGQCQAGCSGSSVSCVGKCTDIAADAENCSTCGNKCGIDEICEKGNCVTPTGGGSTPPDTCNTGLTDCAGSCVDTQKDNSNCGSCGYACNTGAGESCQSGKCSAGCPTGKTDCNGSCVDTQSDNDNCGLCGQACNTSGDETCNKGMCECKAGTEQCGPSCVDTQTDADHCGGCNAACSSGVACANGKCGGAPTFDAGVDGGSSGPKANGEVCTAGNACTSGICSDDGYCCAATCAGDCSTCYGGTCAAISAGYPCSDVPGGGSGLCDGNGSCAATAVNKANGETCAVFGECASGFCSDDKVCCNMDCRDGCGTCKSSTSTNGTCQKVTDGTACGATECIGAGQCLNAICDGLQPTNEWQSCDGGNGVCFGGKCDSTIGAALGASCSNAGECATNICSDDGKCCDVSCTGECNTCASGTCAAKAQGELCLNGQCDGSGVCDTNLPGLKPDGEACVASANDCYSGNCSDDGYCCAVACTGGCTSCSGGSTCDPLYQGAPCTDSIGDQGLCDGAGTCDTTQAVGKDLGETCAAFGECASGFCSHDGVCCDMECRTGCGTCSFPGSPDNGKCVKEADGTTCGGSDCQAAGQCLNAGCEGITPINDWLSCDGGNGVCTGGKCDSTIGNALGATCSSPGDCATNICSDDGKCCDVSCTGECNTCASGTCEGADTSVACSTGFCDGSGACDNTVVLLPDGDVCTGGSECTSGNCSGDGYCCASSCTGDCNSCFGGTCAPLSQGYGCSDNGQFGLCDGAGSCDTSAATNKSLGDSCGAPGECASGICSEDGYCCSTVCGFGGCGICSTGTCVAEPDTTVCGTATECLSTGTCTAGQCGGKAQINDWKFCGTAGVCSGGNCQEGWGDPIGATCTGDAIGSNGCATGICSGFNQFSGGPGARYCCLVAQCDDTECCDCSPGDTVYFNEGGACSVNGGTTCTNGQCL